MVNGKKANLTKAMYKSSLIIFNKMLQSWGKMLIGLYSLVFVGGYSHDYHNQKESIFSISQHSSWSGPALYLFFHC